MRCLLLLAWSIAVSASEIRVPPDIDHGPWHDLLQRRVDGRGLVDYAGLAADPADREGLDRYLAQFARAVEAPATGAERHAALINAYNAFTLRRVVALGVAPDGSFWAHDPFQRRIHPIGGAAVSLDDIEHRALRPEMDYRVHAALVCAAVSCPPLWREAYTADNLETALDQRMAVWLGREDLNRFERERDRVVLSKIFDWFEEDFAAAGGVPAILGRHGPEALRPWLAGGDYRIRHLPYDKALNAQPAGD